MTKAREAPAFAGLPDADLARLLAAANRVTCRDEQTIFARGDPATAVYLVLAGSVRISTLGPSGKRVTVQIFQHGELIGEIAVIDDGTRTADATAMGPVELISLPVAPFRDVLRGSAPLANSLLRLTIGRLRRTYSLLEDASLRPIEMRLAKQLLYLVTLGASGEAKGEGRVRIQARMHQDELADLLGVTTRSIINVLNKWRAEELVNFDGRTAQLTLLDIARFRALAEE